MIKTILKRKKTVALGLALLIGSSIIGYLFLEGPTKALKDKLVLKVAQFSDLAGWQDDQFGAALPAFQQSCRKINKLPGTRSLGANKLAGTAADWKEICREILTLPLESGVIKAFLETKFTPFSVRNEEQTVGLFTGYYEASLHGSLTRSEKYATPLYLRPDELVMVNLGRFRDSLKGQRIAGQIKGGELIPFHDRTQIEKGALQKRDLEILWVDSAVDAFFLHIQGSGRIQMDDGSHMRVGYAAQNGHSYFAIGKTLIEEGHVPREKMSMQAIREWLENNPEKADEVMNKNASYIFFRELKTSGPIGAQGVELTAGRSLAVDRKWMPLGVPIWLQTEIEEDNKPFPINRLLIAQDTGGAIRGPVRGDVFWGNGPLAYERAGAMKSTGEYWILLPNSVAAKHLSKNIS
ncbi:MAG: murein transglycosylase A [Sneathiella sp.]|nr:murein transglycosylase A [Sneathiella sp.]